MKFKKYLITIFLYIIFQLKSTESSFAINRSNDTLESSSEIVSKFDAATLIPALNGTATSNNIKSNHLGANGSVITMTLKNNHLIVETEERNVSKFLFLRKRVRLRYRRIWFGLNPKH